MEAHFKTFALWRAAHDAHFDTFGLRNIGQARRLPVMVILVEILDTDGLRMAREAHANGAVVGPYSHLRPVGIVVGDYDRKVHGAIGIFNAGLYPAALAKPDHQAGLVIKLLELTNDGDLGGEVAGDPFAHEMAGVAPKAVKGAAPIVGRLIGVYPRVRRCAVRHARVD